MKEFRVEEKRQIERPELVMIDEMI